MSLKSLLIFPVLLAILPAASLSAETITVEFEGHVLYTDDDCWCVEDVHVGDPMVGYFIYELGATDVEPSPTQGRYEYSTAPTEIAVSVGSYFVRSRPDNVEIALGVADSLVPFGGTPRDHYAVFSSSNTDFIPYLYTTQISFRLQDPTLTALDNDELPTEAPQLEDWRYASVWIQGSQPWLVVGVVTSILSGTPTGIDNHVPKLLDLTNYPNPFSTTTTFSVSSDARGVISLNIYDVRGRVVRTLAVSKAPPKPGGIISWDGADGSGTPLPSGLYFARIMSQSGTVTRKVTILR